MNKHALTLLAVLATLMVAACVPPPTGPKLTISANPTTAYIIQGGFTTITVGGTDNGKPFPDGTAGFTITSDYGSFESQSWEDSTNDIRSDPNVTTAGGVVTVALFSDETPSNPPAHVSVTFTDSDGRTASAEVYVDFEEAGGPNGTDCTPTGTGSGCVAKVEKLSFSCSSYNVGAFAFMNTTNEEMCTADAFDSLNNLVDGTAINYLPEAGTVQFDSTAGNLAYFPNDPNAAHTSPVVTHPQDLGANSAEPVCGTTAMPRSPRDGLVTLVAWIYADPVAVAGQSLAMYRGEPFVDANDNQVWDQGEDFVDLNGNGVRDAVQDTTHQTALWMQIKVLWSGSYDTNSPVTPVTATIPFGGQQTFTFDMLDSNCNVLAATDSVASWTMDPSGDVSLASPQPMPQSSPADPHHIGMALDANFNFVDPSQALNWEIGAALPVAVVNTYQCNSTLMPESFSLSGQLSAQPVTNGEIATTQPVTGILEPPAATSCSP